MNNEIVVSIIVPCFNLGEYLSETLDSVINQTFENWECIIVDDGSSDNTAEIAKKYTGKDSRMKYFYKENQGVSIARNFGISKSQGKYILPLDADDLIRNTYVEKAAQKLEEDPSLSLVYCNADFFGKKNGPFVLADYSYERLLYSNIIFCTAMYRKDDFLKTTGYSSDMNGGLEDWEFWINLLKNNGKVHRIQETLFLYRIRGASRSTKLEGDLKMLVYEKHKDIYIKHWGTPFELYEYKTDYLALISRKFYKLYKLLFR